MPKEVLTVKNNCKGLIGSGMQFDVYESDNDRVLKIPKSFDATIVSFLEKENESTIETAKSASRYYCDTRTLCLKFISKGYVDYLFANPLQDDETLTQDKVIPFSDYLSSKRSYIPDNELRDLCLKAVKINFNLWSFGVGENTFGMDKYGINKLGDLTLYDPFEMTDCKDDLKYLIVNKWWLQCNRFYSQEILQIINEIFTKHLTIEALMKHFNENAVGLHSNETRIQPIKDFISGKTL